MGQAYIKAHLYEKAITYYKAAIKSSGASELRYDLAELLYQMGRHEESAEVVRAALDSIQNAGKRSSTSFLLALPGKRPTPNLC